MGFDIDIRSFSIKKGKAKKLSHKGDLYLSWNWGDLSDICPNHFLKNDGKCPECCKCERTHLWYIRDDCHTRTGSSIAISTKKALDYLDKYGISPGKPDVLNSNWGYGLHKDSSPLLPIERLGVFAYHLKWFRDEAIKYSKCFFIVDCGENDNGNNHLILDDGSKISQYKSEDGYSESQDESEDESEDAYSLFESQYDYDNYSLVTWYIHPFKGIFRVDSFKKAMEIYGFLKAQEDESAQLWWDLAMRMKDVPHK
jgi:hypothetical protein